MDYKELYSVESHGQYGSFGLKLLVAGPDAGDVMDVRLAAMKASDAVRDAVMTAALSRDQSAQEEAAKERADLLGLFNDAIFAETIPNGYCSQWCCRHLPWFVVTTKVGRFKIGWRKRVISIDWSETVGTPEAESLFSSESVTKGERSIHAWSLDDARRYIAAIINTNPRS